MTRDDPRDSRHSDRATRFHLDYVNSGFILNALQIAGIKGSAYTCIYLAFISRGARATRFPRILRIKHEMQ
jgi:hypothetical protein